VLLTLLLPLLTLQPWLPQLRSVLQLWQLLFLWILQVLWWQGSRSVADNFATTHAMFALIAAVMAEPAAHMCAEHWV
jgi:hypothetical protein